MRVLLKTTLAGPDGTAYPGIHNFPDTLAKQLIEGDFAELVPETASISPPETAVMPRAQARRKKKND